MLDGVITALAAAAILSLGANVAMDVKPKIEANIEVTR